MGSPPEKGPAPANTFVNHRGVFDDEYLVTMILSHLRGNLGVLSKLSTVSPLFHEAAEQFLWSCATIKDLVNCAADSEKLATYASFLHSAQILSPNDVWPEGIVPCPTFIRLKQLRIFNEVLRTGGSVSVMPLLVPSLQRLELQNRTRREQQIAGQHDGELMTQISSTCCSLTTLLLESSLHISSAEFSTFFRPMDQLKVLRLGTVLSDTLDEDVMAEVFSLPHLEDLSSDFQLDLAFVTALRNEREAHKILPRIKKLEITFSEGGGLASALLLAVIPTVEQLWLTLAHVVEGHDVSLHPSTFEMLGLMTKLALLQVTLEPGMQLTYNELAALSPLEHLISVHITRIYGRTDPDTIDIQISGQELAASLLGFSSLEALWLGLAPANINATYDEALIISHRLAELSPYHERFVNIVVDEASSFGWPSFQAPEPVTVQSAASDLIWQASSDNFAPDPVKWAPRDLNFYTNANGEIIPLDSVVTDGVYNHLTHCGT
ncbi:hypothetical protein KCV07_g6746, partial [Aureobasidium melanogenum]